MAQKLSARAFAEFLTERAAKKDGYILCATGQDPKTLSSWWFNQYTGSGYVKAIYWRDHAERVWDCNGLAEGYYKDQTGQGINTRARYNYASWCSAQNKGAGMIPADRRVPGAAVYWGASASQITHVAFLTSPVTEGHPEGDWKMVEARGVTYGVVTTLLSKRKPAYWGWMDKYFSYDALLPNAADKRTALSRGDEGEDVRDLQKLLMKNGYALPKWGADGEFGRETEMAVNAFRVDRGMEPTGVADETVNKLLKGAGDLVVCAAEGAYLRAGPGEEYAQVCRLKAGDRVSSAACAGYTAVVHDLAVYWIEDQCVKGDA